MQTVSGLPKLSDENPISDARVHGTSVYVKTRWSISKICLTTATLHWLYEYPHWIYSNEVCQLPRRIHCYRGTLWIDHTGRYVAELSPHNDGGARIAVRETLAGKVLWQHLIAIPNAAEWAEKEPAWPGAPTEEIDAFLCDNAQFLVLGLARRSRRSGCSSPSRNINVMDYAPYGCQLDLRRFDPTDGTILWDNIYHAVYADIMERMSFNGQWSHLRKCGVIDFKTGESQQLHESPHELGPLVRENDHYAVSWHSRKQVGIEWYDNRGICVKSCSWDCAKIKSTMLHATSAGLALQANDQFLTWLGSGTQPLWTVTAKPYIYKVLAFPGTDVFIGTDGRGGRLLCHDQATGRETLNHKPVFGGKGDLIKVPSHDVIIATECVSKTYSVPPQLYIINTRSRTLKLDPGGCGPLCVWEHGAVCTTGKNSECLAVYDARES